MIRNKKYSASTQPTYALKQIINLHFFYSPRNKWNSLIENIKLIGLSIRFKTF